MAGQIRASSRPPTRPRSAPRGIAPPTWRTLASGVLAFAVAALLPGCEHHTLISAEGGVPWDAPRPVADAPSHECQPDATSNDFWNCGACDVTCPPERADRCLAGFCMCGLGPACQEGSGCRFDRCIDSDPDGTVCEFDDECPAGLVCIAGHCSLMECVPEVCDGVDNDCDGFADGSATSPLVERCFSGPTTAMLQPPCRPGYRICNFGAWSPCLDEVAPFPETGLFGCDGVDNDCDGCRDGTFANDTGICVSVPPRTFDIAFIVDVSASMSEEILAVKEATATFSRRFSSNEAFRFALLTVSGQYDRPVETKIDLTSFSRFHDELDRLRVGSGYFEPTYDVIHDLGTGDLPLAWADGSVRILVIFTDEPGQTARDRFLSESDACAALTHDELVAVVTSPALYDDFDECATLLELSADPTRMAMNLETIIANPCN